jgi:hypothetical protein
VALPMHLDHPQRWRIWSCRFPVRTACTRWISNESGVTTVDSLVDCPQCLAIIANRGQVELFKATEEKTKREEMAVKVAEARRAAMARKRDKLMADQASREKRGTERREG